MNLRLCTLFLLFASASGAKILGIFPFGARSHFSFNKAIMNSLHKAGHQITVITAYADTKSMENFTVLVSQDRLTEFRSQGTIKDFVKMSMANFFDFGINAFVRDCRGVMGLKEVKEIWNSPKNQYDLIFMEYTVTFSVCYEAIAAKLRVPLIQTLPVRTDLYLNTFLANHNHPALVPNGFTYTPTRMNFVQRLENTIYYVYMLSLIVYQCIPATFKLWQECDPNVDFQLRPKAPTSLVFQNSHPMLLPRAMVPNFIEIGGIHLKPTSPLSQDIEKFVDEAQHGVILFSFGTLTAGAPLDDGIKTIFKRVFAKIPQRVIWKYDETIEGLSSNVLVMKWIPQNDILAHKNVKVFITHCGLAGIYEAISGSVPMLLVPFFGDQLPNAAALEERGAGIYLNILTLSEDAILDSLNTIINNSSYRENVEKLSRIFKDMPMSPQKSVVYWTEYVLRHKGAEHLKTAAIEMPYHQYLLLDVILFVVVVTMLLIYVIRYLLKKIIRLCFKNEKSNSIDKNKKLK